MRCLFIYIDVGLKSPFQRRKPKSAIQLKKQVKFTDDVNVTDIVPTMSHEKKEERNDVTIDGPSQGWLTPKSLVEV